jgi:hypothetical protein
LSTVFFHYNSVQKSLYWSDRSVIFFDEYGWWLLENDVRVKQSLDQVSESNFDLEKIYIPRDIEFIRSWSATWSRWSGKGDQQELKLRRVYLLVLSIAAGLKKLNVRRCVMHTGVSHHVDSLAFEMACNLLSIPVLFLYAEIFKSRLIPILQFGLVDTRRPLALEISSHHYSEIIEEFIANKKLEHPPKGTLKASGIPSMPFFAIPILIWYDIKKYLRILIFNNLRRSPKSNIFEFTLDTYPFQFVMQGWQQMRAIKYLKKKSKLEHYFLNNSYLPEYPKLIIAAHYQPEATSFPEGGVWGNHIDIALELIRKGCKGKLIYKEHPASTIYLEAGSPTRVGMSRSREYYEQLEAIGCEFLTSEYKLSVDPKKCYWYIPVTITGTIAIERSLAGLHTIVTGHPWFKGMPGVLLLNEVDSFCEIKREWITPNPEVARNAFEFLIYLLDNKTINNISGIGTGKDNYDKKDVSAFAEEFSVMLREYVNLDTVKELTDSYPINKD